MKRIISAFFLLGALLVVACNKPKEVPDKILGQIFHDAMLVNAYLNMHPDFKLDSLNIYEPIFAEYGYFVEKVVSVTLPGKEGLGRMKEIMAGLRTNPPAEICGMKVTAVRDYKTGLRTANGVSEPTGLPTSDVLYFELENGNWVCVRPSGTEPKIKLYVNVNDKEEAKAKELLSTLTAASQELLK